MTTRKKSGKAQRNEYEKPLFVGSFTRIIDAVNKAGEGLVLNEKGCASIIYQIQNFMEENFGRHSAQPRSMTKIPYYLFRDFRQGGSVECILKGVVGFMKENGWNSFDISGSDLRSFGCQLLKKLESLLIRARFLERPVVYFGKVPDVASLKEIVLRHGGFLCGSPEVATHIIEWDDEVDNLPEDLPEEYVRTLDLRPLENGGVALVHWYYFPDSYDEWISSQDVDAVDPPDIYPLRGSMQAGSKCQPWKLCCRFIKDCDLFNEWGNEIDYEILDESDPEAEEDTTSMDVVSSPTATKTGRSPGNGRKVKKGETKKPISPRREAPIVGSTTACTDRMMQDAPPPSRDKKRGKIALVDIPAAIAGAAAAQANTIALVDTVQNGVDAISVAENAVEDNDVAAVSGKKRKAESDSVGMSAPDWFDASKISAEEIRYLPGYFGGNYSSKKRERYMTTRTTIIALYQQNPSIYLSATECRRKIAGDVCEIVRLHEFLDAFGIINTYVKAENRPPLPVSVFHYSTTYNKAATDVSKPKSRSGDIDKLLVIVGYRLNGDWAKVSIVLKQKYGLQISPEECLNRFVEIPSDSLGEYLKTTAPVAPVALSATTTSTKAVDKAEIEHKMAVEDSNSATVDSAATNGTAKDNASGAGETSSPSKVPADSTPAANISAQQVVSSLRHACGSSPASSSSSDIRRLVAHLSSSSSGKLQPEDTDGQKCVGMLVSDTLSNVMMCTGQLVDDYLNARLAALEEKADLLTHVKTEIYLEKRQLELERRDIQIQRALFASQSLRNSLS